MLSTKLLEYNHYSYCKISLFPDLIIFFVDVIVSQCCLNHLECFLKKYNARSLFPNDILCPLLQSRDIQLQESQALRRVVCLLNRLLRLIEIFVQHTPPGCSLVVV